MRISSDAKRALCLLNRKAMMDMVPFSICTNWSAWYPTAKLASERGQIFIDESTVKLGSRCIAAPSPSPLTTPSIIPPLPMVATAGFVYRLVGRCHPQKNDCLHAKHRNGSLSSLRRSECLSWQANACHAICLAEYRGKIRGSCCSKFLYPVSTA